LGSSICLEDPKSAILMVSSSFFENNIFSGLISLLKSFKNHAKPMEYVIIRDDVMEGLNAL
jgi:hypothetical protein